jgi:hypothetical protein
MSSKLAAGLATNKFYPTVRTSDVLDLDFLDYVFDCHRLDEWAI